MSSQPLRYASWREFFSNTPDTDRLNNSANRILRAAHQNITASPIDRFTGVSFLPQACTLAASPMAGHVWFAHHFSFIGNPILDDPADLTYVALCGIGENAEASLVNIQESFRSTTFDAPPFDALMHMQNRQDFNAAATNDITEQVSVTGVICLPPLLFTDITAIHWLDAYSIFQEAKSSVNSWVATFEDDTNQAIIDRQQDFKCLLQWLWAVNQGNLIPTSPIQPTPGHLEQQWRQQLHQLHIQSASYPSTHPTNPATTLQGITVTAPPELTLAMAKIADTFQLKHSDDTKAKELKEPSWTRFTSNAKTIILRAMTTDSTNPATELTPTLLEFCTQRTAFIAHQQLLTYFETKGRSRSANISQGMSSALYTGIIRAPTPGMPENLSIFFTPKKTSSTPTNLSQTLITQSLKSTEGQGLDTSEIKLATKQRISIPANYHDLLTQLENFKLLLAFIFGESSIIFLQFFTVTSHVKSYEHEYEERIQNHQWFLSKFISYLDRRIQLFLESCSTAATVTQINYSLLNFDNLLQSIIDGTFSMDLPSVIQKALVPTTQPEPNQNTKKQTPEQPDAKTQNKRTTPQRGEPSINSSIHPPWRLKDGETYSEHFVRRIDRTKLPNCDVCLNYHIRGTCHTLCTRADTHVPFMNLSEQQRNSTTDFIRAARTQYAQQHNRPRPN